VQPQYAQWYAAGYAPIVVNESYVGGVVREFGNLSFSRIYDAGHLVPAYQPETAFTVFTRIIQGVDISLGIAIDLSLFGTEGNANATQTNIAPPMLSPTCFIRAVNETCNTDQKNMLANGAGVTINGVLYAAASDWQPPAANISSTAGQPGTAPISMMSSAPPSVSTKGGSARETTNTVPTGVYVATGTPTTSATSTGGAIATGLNVQRAMRRGVSLSMLFLGAVCV
jgi:Serine carboxypeptidase